MPRKLRVPTYSLHRATGQARVRLDGRTFYLGQYQSSESHRRYRELVDAWIARQRSGAKVEISVGQLAILYLQHAEAYYVKGGRQTSQVHSIRSALRVVVKLFRNELVSNFGPLKLQKVRDEVLKLGVARVTVNRYIALLVSAFRWGVSQEYVPAPVLTALESVQGLRAGRCTARETKPVSVVPVDVVLKTLPHMPRNVGQMVELQMATGMRPCEVVAIRPCDLNTSGMVWEYRVDPGSNKMHHHGRTRIVCIGPRGQELLKRALPSRTTAFVFPSQPDGMTSYGTAAYRRAITRACEIAFGMPVELRDINKTLRGMKDVPPEEKEKLKKKMRREAKEWRAENCWAPNRLRHTFGTLARREAGIEAARVTLGHSSAVTSEIYAERDLEAAKEIVKRIG